jgi:hypothetical protein
MACVGKLERLSSTQNTQVSLLWDSEGLLGYISHLHCSSSLFPYFVHLQDSTEKPNRARHRACRVLLSKKPTRSSEAVLLRSLLPQCPHQCPNAFSSLGVSKRCESSCLGRETLGFKLMDTKKTQPMLVVSGRVETKSHLCGGDVSKSLERAGYDCENVASSSHTNCTENFKWWGVESGGCIKRAHSFLLCLFLQSGSYNPQKTIDEPTVRCVEESLLRKHADPQL